MASIRQIEASGDPFTIGKTLGRAAGDAVRAHVFAHAEFLELNARWAGSDYLAALEAASRAAYPEYVREVEGIAAGAELDFPTIFLWNCRGDLRLPEDASPAAQAEAGEGCTTVFLPGTIGHNEDGAPGFLGECFWVSVTLDHGTAFNSFMYPGMLPGHTFGVNAAGLVQTINNIRVHDLKPGIPRHIICRAVLGSETLDAALTILRRTDRASGFHHALGQAGDDRLLSVEAPASGCHVRPVNPPHAHANHLIEASFEGIAQEVTDSSRNRQSRAEKMLCDGDYLRPEEILFDNQAPIYRANDAGDDYSQTLATAIFEFSADRVNWRIHASPVETDAIVGSRPITRHHRT